MPEHFTKSTVEATFRCGPCGKETPHFVFDGRRGGCKICIKRREDEAKLPQQAPTAKQESLF